MSHSKRFFLIFLPILFFIGCRKDVTPQDKGSIPEEKIEISEFYFRLAQNSSLTEDLIPLKDSDNYKAALPKYARHKLIATYSTNAEKVLINGVQQQSGISVNDFTNEVQYSFIGKKGGKKDVKVIIEWQNFDIPHIKIMTVNGEKVTSKDNYLKATINIDGKERYRDYSGSTEIKGRGNSTWGFPKKPYRLKLNSKSEILGIPSAKNWVLLANYLDPSLMCNAVAMKIGKDLDVPFTNTIIPVDLTLNDVYQGSYVLTQQIEVNENRVDIGDDGYLLELDTYFDEEYKFSSSSYSLPVMIKNPELNTASGIVPIQTEFEAFESLIKAPTFPNNTYKNYFDIDVFSKYILVYFLTGNEEINHPKSMYMHKKTGGKFLFGPLWDFDWAYGYEGSGSHFNNPIRPFFWNGSTKGTVFFKRLFEDPAVRATFKSNWINYKQKHLPNLLTYIDEYATLIKSSKVRDEAVWKKGKVFEQEVTKLKRYIEDRAGYIDNFIN